MLAIRAFARVVESGSFTKAADSLEMPKATLTKLVQALERHLRVQLLQRTTRQVSVTAEGTAYYERATRVVMELDDVDMSFSAAQGRPRGQLRVDMGSSAANLVVIPALPEFFAQYPDIRIDVSVSDRPVDMIGENVDCAIRGGALSDLSIVSRQIGKAPWVTCAAPAYLKRHGTPRHPKQLEEDHVVVSYLSTRTSRPMPMSFGSKGQRRDIVGTRRVGVNESNAHVAAGVAGLGVIHTFHFLARPHIESGALVPILLNWQPAPYPFHLVYPPNRHMSNRLRMFIDWIADRFPRLTA